uniref:Uncharacterized protein n=1 Tax=Oryza meridionalis TaxID=40149 RepID=A0A0E0BZU1_9ORYZ
MPDGPSRTADADDDDELSRLLYLAGADLDAGHLRAACLDPDSPRGSLLLTAVSILIADHSSHHASGVSLDEGGGERGGVDDHQERESHNHTNAEELWAEPDGDANLLLVRRELELPPTRQ